PELHPAPALLRMNPAHTRPPGRKRGSSTSVQHQGGRCHPLDRNREGLRDIITPASRERSRLLCFIRAQLCFSFLRARSRPNTISGNQTSTGTKGMSCSEEAHITDQPPTNRISARIILRSSLTK